MNESVTLYQMTHPDGKCYQSEPAQLTQAMREAYEFEGFTIEPITYHLHPPISREDLETVCEAADGWASEFDSHFPSRQKVANGIRAAIARVREACK